MRPLVIGIDARELIGNRTGVGTYLGEVLRRWMTRDDIRSRHFILYTPEPLAWQLPPSVGDVRVLRGSRGTWWEQTTLSSGIRKDAPDVFFAPAYSAPISIAVPLAAAIHDVSFSRHPEWFRFRERTRRRWLTRSTARRADVVLTGSAFSKQEIQQLYGISPAKVKVIVYGVTCRSAPVGASREPIVLYVGSIFNRRHLPHLIAAFAGTAKAVPQARLVIVGENRTYPAEDLEAIARNLGVAERVSLRSYLGDDELASLYARASVFAFLSEYEGFGFTPLEALAAGLPIVVVDTPVAREVYGAAAEFVPAGDISAAANALTRLLTSDEARSAQLAHAAEVLARYSWDAAAASTLAEVERIARR